MTHTWIDPKEVIIPKSLREIVGGHSLIAEILVRRGINDPDKVRSFLDPEYYTPTQATELPDIQKAAIRILLAVDKGEMILIWGDFDVDGQTSTTLLVEALREIGASVEYHIPIRATEGHGIQVSILEQIINKNPAICLLLTCDTGITAHESVDFAKAKGLDVIITDHHDLPESIPQAYAIVNPKLLQENHPLATLPGVGVAYKLVEAIFDSQQPTTNNNLSTKKFLDLVALGIVADVATQHGDTRYLLQIGLQVLRNTKRLGLQILMELAQIIPSQLDEEQIGFGIGPRLNALGRLSDANPIVEFLTTKDSSLAWVFATQLEGLNERRKLLTQQITQAALTQIDQNEILLKRAALVLAHPGWHTGVIGIVASRLVERFRKPSILLSVGDDGIARGSARSIEGVHITDAIASQKQLLIGFGGHPGAAGLSLTIENLPEFSRGLRQAVQAQLGDQSSELLLQIDAYIPLKDISLKLTDEIGRLAPFGAGNPLLTFVSQNLRLINHTIIGRQKEHLRLVVADEDGNHQNVLWWNGAGNLLPDTDIPFDLAYKLQTSTYRGERTPQIQWVDFHYREEPHQQTKDNIPSIEVFDLRDEAYPSARLKSIQSEQEIQIWAEGETKTKLGGLDRWELSTKTPLVLWTTPPGPIEWQNILENVKPKKIFLFAIDPKADDPKTYLERLTGLVKFALHARDGKANLEILAAATCQRENTVWLGLQWLEAKGVVNVIRQDKKTLQLMPGSNNEDINLAKIEAELISILAETAAYRVHFGTKKNILS